ncbi:MAG TPA: arabinofuranosyltransferase [bacterium]|jgi:hypothetical protein|nr:arabinofuranosyltransferase [bacterium]
MNFSDIQIYSSIKIILMLFAILAAYLIIKKKNPLYLLLLFGLTSAGTYALWSNNLQLPLWGLQGDELTIAAIFNTLAKIGFSSDFSYHGLPPFYPPGSFWFFSFWGRLFNWNGIIMMKVAATTFFLLFPAVVFLLQRYLFKNILPNHRLNVLLATLSPLLIMTVLDKDLIIGKPYEIVAAVATILWTISLYHRVNNQRWTIWQPLIYGLAAGLIFMTYYLWLAFAAIALIIMGLTEKNNHRLRYFWRLTQTAIVSFIATLPFTGPLLSSYLKNGLESWQTALFTPTGLNLWLPMFQLTSWTNLIFLFGLGALIYYHRDPIARQLLYLFSTAFIWWGGGLLSLLIWHKPFQEFRGFYIWAPTILAMGAAYGLSRIWQHYNLDQKTKTATTLALLGLGLLIAQSFFGFFIDDPTIRNQRIKSKQMDPSIVQLSQYLNNHPLPQDSLTLETVPQLLAIVPINNLIYFNQHNNHPAAIFSKRYNYVQDLATAKSPVELIQKINNCPFGPLERFIFYGDQENYYLYFHVDKFISGLEEKTIKFNRQLFVPPYFQVNYNNLGYYVIDVQK